MSREHYVIAAYALACLATLFYVGALCDIQALGADPQRMIAAEVVTIGGALTAAGACFVWARRMWRTAEDTPV